MHAETTSAAPKELTDDEQRLLESQNSRMVGQHQAGKLEAEAKKHWDLFYKRNENRFFKDRHWTTREFEELLDLTVGRKVLLEIGCGVGNMVFPLVEENSDFFVYACDFSPRAIEIVKSHRLYDKKRMKAFQADITVDNVVSVTGQVDVATMIFVLSAIHPDKFREVLWNVWVALKPGGVLLFRDYGLYDMAQLRFKPGHKIGDNFYMRQDGTRSYYFSCDELQQLFTDTGFEVKTCEYVHRRTVNKKENVDVPRIFVQAKAIKPIYNSDRAVTNTRNKSKESTSCSCSGGSCSCSGGSCSCSLLSLGGDDDCCTVS